MMDTSPSLYVQWQLSTQSGYIAYNVTRNRYTEKYLLSLQEGCGGMTRDIAATTCSYCGKDLRPIKQDEGKVSPKQSRAQGGNSSPTPTRRTLRRSTSLSDLSEVLNSTKTSSPMISTPSEELESVHSTKPSKVDNSKFVKSIELAKIAGERPIEFGISYSHPKLSEQQELAFSTSSPESSFLRLSPRQTRTSPSSSLPNGSFLDTPSSITHLSLNSSPEVPKRNASWPSPRDIKAEKLSENHCNENFAVGFMSRIRSKHVKTRPRSTSAAELEKMKREEEPRSPEKQTTKLFGLLKIKRRMTPLSTKSQPDVSQSPKLEVPIVPLCPLPLNDMQASPGARIVQEIKVTEWEYLRDLAVMVALEEVTRKFWATGHSGVTLKDVAGIFRNVDEIFQKHDLQIAYAKYCQAYHSTIKLVDNLRLRPEFETFYKQLYQIPECRGLTLEGFLIKPVQRVCKYPLLLKELIRVTPQEHAHRPALLKALEDFEGAVEDVNESQREYEMRRTISQIQNELQQAGEIVEIKSPTRRLIRKGAMAIMPDETGVRGKIKSSSLRGPRQAMDGTYYLFHDMVLLTTTKKKTKKIAANIPLEEALIRECQDFPDENSLEIVHAGRKIWRIMLASTKEKQGLKVDLEKAIEACYVEHYTKRNMPKN